VQSDFVRGDANSDGFADISDPVYVLSRLFTGGPAPQCLQTADANDDNAVDLSDSVCALNHLFLGGPPLSAPVDECGQDPTPPKDADNALSRDAFAPCDA